MENTTYRRENYFKYCKVREQLLKDILEGKSAKQTAKDCNISQATYFKYKNLLSAESGKVYTIAEELDFIDRQHRQAELEKSNERL